MPLFQDQMQRPVTISERPQRIVSLVPSQTELLYDLGLGERVVGITKFCIHPPNWRREKTVIGGTKKFNFSRIEELNPDLIIGNKEENYREGIEALEKEFPVWMSDIYNLVDALEMMEQVGGICGVEREGAELSEKINREWLLFPPFPEKANCIYLIWKEPYMAVGGNTFIDDILARCGFRNLLSGRERYPELSEKEIVSIRPDYILLSSEPYPFKEVHIAEIKNCCPRAEVILVDGEMFSWYGSRLLKAVSYLKGLASQIRTRG